MKTTLLACLITIFMLGCNLEYLYSLKKLNDVYCSETNEDKRKLIIDIIRKKKPDYPEDGLCGVENVIAEKLS